MHQKKKKKKINIEINLFFDCCNDFNLACRVKANTTGMSKRISNIENVHLNFDEKKKSKTINNEINFPFFRLVDCDNTHLFWNVLQGVFVCG